MQILKITQAQHQQQKHIPENVLTPKWHHAMSQVLNIITANNHTLQIAVDQKKQVQIQQITKNLLTLKQLD